VDLLATPLRLFPFWKGSVKPAMAHMMFCCVLYIFVDDIFMLDALSMFSCDVLFCSPQLGTTQKYSLQGWEIRAFVRF